MGALSQVNHRGSQSTAVRSLADVPHTCRDVTTAAEGNYVRCRPRVALHNFKTAIVMQGFVRLSTSSVVSLGDVGVPLKVWLESREWCSVRERLFMRVWRFLKTAKTPSKTVMHCHTGHNMCNAAIFIMLSPPPRPHFTPYHSTSLVHQLASLAKRLSFSRPHSSACS